MVRPVLRFLATPFYSLADRRVRSLWRIGIGTATLLLPLFVVGPTVRRVSTTIADRSPYLLDTIGPIAASLYIASGVLLTTRAIDRRRGLGDLGLRGGRTFLQELGIGSALGIALIAAIALFELASGLATYRVAPALAPSLPPRALLIGVTLIFFVSVALNEELLFRGFLMTNLAEGFRHSAIGRVGAIGLATALSSVLFGMAHNQNDHASAISSLFISIAGLMLGVGYVWTGRLGVPIGLHLTWNLTQNLCGMPVSGIDRFQYAALLTREPHGPSWITGGEFGPEAGLTGLVAMTLGGGLVAMWIFFRRGSLKPTMPLWLPPRPRPSEATDNA